MISHKNAEVFASCFNYWAISSEYSKHFPKRKSLMMYLKFAKNGEGLPLLPKSNCLLGLLIGGISGLIIKID